MLKNISKTPVVLKKSFKLLFVSLHFFFLFFLLYFKIFLISSFKRLSRLGIVTEIRQHVKFVYLMSFNHFQLARVNQLLQITYGQSAVFLNCQGKQVEYWLWCARNVYRKHNREKWRIITKHQNKRYMFLKIAYRLWKRAWRHEKGTGRHMKKGGRSALWKGPSWNTDFVNHCLCFCSNSCFLYSILLSIVCVFAQIVVFCIVFCWELFVFLLK